jgi:hypothetical protein
MRRNHTVSAHTNGTRVHSGSPWCIHLLEIDGRDGELGAVGPLRQGGEGAAVLRRGDVTAGHSYHRTALRRQQQLGDQLAPATPGPSLSGPPHIWPVCSLQRGVSVYASAPPHAIVRSAGGSHRAAGVGASCASGRARRPSVASDTTASMAAAARARGAHLSEHAGAGTPQPAVARTVVGHSPDRASRAQHHGTVPVRQRCVRRPCQRCGGGSLGLGLHRPGRRHHRTAT